MKWIPVKERIPEARKLVLVHCEQKSEYTGELYRHRTIAEYIPERSVLAGDYLDPSDDWRWEDEGWEYDEKRDDYWLPESWYEKAWFNCDYSGWHLSATVTHWMPLPEMPEREEAATCREK